MKMKQIRTKKREEKKEAYSEAIYVEELSTA